MADTIGQSSSPKQSISAFREKESTTNRAAREGDALQLVTINCMLVLQSDVRQDP